MPQREPALLWLRDCALTALVLALCTLTSWVFFRLDFVSSNYILTYFLGVMYLDTPRQRGAEQRNAEHDHCRYHVV